MIKGLDSPVNCTAHAAMIAGQGFEFVGRYYRSQHSRWATLTQTEASALHGASLKIVTLWESASDHLGYFSYSQGVDDSTSACNQALLAGQPPQTPIYFAVDFDASSDDLKGAVHDYFVGVAAGYAAMRRDRDGLLVGVYGSGRTCDWLLGQNLVTHSWLAVSRGWAGHEFSNWDIAQGALDQQLGVNADLDEAKPNYGGF